MRHASVFRSFVLALAGAAWVAAGAEAGPKKPPPPPGIRWEASLEGALDRAKREGRPLLVCINALENQVPQLPLELYPSEAWGRATRGYVALVANPEDHAEKDGVCSRFGHAPCACHKDTLRWVLRRFAPDGNLISPQHLILEPDGGVAYRKEFFTGEEGPYLFGFYLSRLAPELAVRLAGIDRAERTATLAKAAPEKAGEAARAWLTTADDGLAAAGVLSALLDTEAPAKRLALIDAFAAAPAGQVPVLVPTLEAVTGAPDEKPEESVRWITAVFAVERETAAWAAARALVRTKNAALRERILTAWTGSKTLEDAGALAPGERARLDEALRLAQQRVPAGLDVRDDLALEEVSLARRTRARAKVATGGAKLPSALGALAPAALRSALLAASPEDVKAREADVALVLRQTPFARVRYAAAVALFRARRPAQGEVEKVLMAALADPLEGPETRTLLAPPRDADPGEDPEAWALWIRGRLGAPK